MVHWFYLGVCGMKLSISTLNGLAHLLVTTLIDFNTFVEISWLAEHPPF